MTTTIPIIVVIACFARVTLCDSEQCNEQLCTGGDTSYCLDDGAIVNGCSALRRAVCQDGRQLQSWQEGENCLPVGFCDAECRVVNARYYCMTDGSIVNGCEGFKKAVCVDKKVHNRSWNRNYECRPSDFCDGDVCTDELTPHCMNDGTIVNGCSELKQAECRDGKKEKRNWTPGQECLADK